MLTTDTKRRIDSTRDILVGQLPLPSDQVELITIGLIYKFMDDMDEQSRDIGGKASFFSGEMRELSWRQLISNTLGAEERVTKFIRGIEEISKADNPRIPELFKSIFKNAFLKFRDGQVLKLFLDEINGFTYDHSEELGNAFEYLLQSMGIQGENGQFRTPRHIIDFIVNSIEPRTEEKILDPACGTAGFLVSAYKHILRQNTREKLGDILTAAQRESLQRSITGYDITPQMVRLARVNLFLHSFPNPAIHDYGTLTNESRWNEKADLILANPPFMTPKGGVAPHTRFSIKSRRTEVLFLDYVLEHLTPQGRAGIIVPEGIMFVDQKAQERLRKILVGEKMLVAAVSLPHGVFKPYASVKTHILFIDRLLAPRTDKVLFIEANSDGFTQTDTRQPVQENDLPAAQKLVQSLRHALQKGAPSPDIPPELTAYFVARDKILHSERTHLIGRWYDLPSRLRRKHNLDYRPLGKLCHIWDGRSPNMATAPGDYPMVVPAEERKTADHFDFDEKAVCIPLVSSSGHGKADIKRLHYHEGKFALADTMCCLVSKNEREMDPKFLFAMLSELCDSLLVPLMAGATNVTMKSTQIAAVEVPVPAPPDQTRIVKRIELLHYADRVEELLREMKRDLQAGVSQMDANHLEKLAEKLREEAKHLPTLKQIIGS